MIPDYEKSFSNMARLTKDFGKGFDESNLRNMRNFYIVVPICDAVRRKLKLS